MPIASQRITAPAVEEDRRREALQDLRQHVGLVLIGEPEVDAVVAEERQDVADVVDELHRHGLVEPELLADRLDQLRRGLAAGAQHGGVAGRQHVKITNVISVMMNSRKTIQMSRRAM